MEPKKDTFDFDFGEKSTRKSAVMAAVLAVVFFFFYQAELLFDLSSRSDGFGFSAISSLLFGGISFFLGLVLFKGNNLTVFLFYPTWFLASRLFTSHRMDTGEVLWAIIGSFGLAMLGFIALGLAIEWIKRGR